MLASRSAFHLAREASSGKEYVCPSYSVLSFAAAGDALASAAGLGDSARTWRMQSPNATRGRMSFFTCGESSQADAASTPMLAKPDRQLSGQTQPLSRSG